MPLDYDAMFRTLWSDVDSSGWHAITFFGGIICVAATPYGCFEAFRARSRGQKYVFRSSLLMAAAMLFYGLWYTLRYIVGPGATLFAIPGAVLLAVNAIFYAKPAKNEQKAWRESQALLKARPPRGAWPPAPAIEADSSLRSE